MSTKINLVKSQSVVNVPANETIRFPVLSTSCFISDLDQMCEKYSLMVLRHHDDPQ
jgi:hypothetical protein